jgi:hypothetical protein
MNDPEALLASFRKTVAELAWAEKGQVEIVKAEHPDNAGLIGAAALFYETIGSEKEGKRFSTS